jgi:SAM-dependent methyltransferase
MGDAQRRGSMNGYLSSASCKICHSAKVFEVQLVPVDRLVSAWKRELGLELSSVFENIPQIRLLECDTCHLRFFVPDSYPGAEKIYPQLDQFYWYYMPFKWEHSMALKDLKGLRKIFEIGCGEGHFIERLQLEGAVEARGIDMNENAVREAQRRRLPVYCMDLREATSKWTNYFDAICSFQVLEHVSNPRDFLDRASSMLRPGGKLLLGIPNAESFLKHQFNILDMPPHHLTRWGSKVFSYLPNLFPLAIQHIKEEPLAKYHVDDYLEAYCGMIKRVPWMRKACAPRIKKVVSASLRYSGAHLLLKGHSLYASFIRNGG